MGAMDVLAFSTVPTLPAGTGVVEVITEPAAHISEALADLADAGLTVTGPSVTMTHPLARHLSRTAVIHRFERPADYTARGLVEFAAWAMDLNCVFRIGNGPFRNVDGENLLAPGNEVKVPVHPEARNRRLRNLRSLREAGYYLNEELPAVPADAELILRDPAEVTHRLCALSVIAVAAGHLLRGYLPPADDLIAGVDLRFTAREQGFLDAIFSGRTGVTPALTAEAVTFRDAAFAAEALGWALTLVDAPPSRTTAWSFTADDWRDATDPALPGEVLDAGCAVVLAGTGVLRDPSRILEALDLVHVVHHSLEVGAGAGVGEYDWATGSLPLVARAWTRALAWICAPGSGWGEAERLI